MVDQPCCFGACDEVVHGSEEHVVNHQAYEVVRSKTSVEKCLGSQHPL